MVNEIEILRARSIFHRKKGKPDFIYFTEKGIDYFVSWYLTLEKRCCYCGIEEYKLKELFETRLFTKRRRGKTLELERFNAKTNLYTEDNCGLACYFCNNHKSDLISSSEHKNYFASPIGRYLNDLYGEICKITDAETNTLFLSDLLQKMYPDFYNRFIEVLKSEGVPVVYLPDTQDVWAVDFMPIQVNSERLVQFTYNPDYLRNYKAYVKTITDTDKVCDSLNLSRVKSEILLDGGNVVRSKTKVIMTSKIFKENPGWAPHKLINEIERLLELQLIVIPVEPGDWVGHSDGMVRFLDENTVLINDYTQQDDLYYLELKMALRNAGLNLIDIPYKKPLKDEPVGLYINYLQMNGKVFLPVFDIQEDESAVRRFEDFFPDFKVIPVLSNEIAKQGGVLNCISWNVMNNI